ncbi:MAG: hypothetical protein OIF35_11890, partial [Cellvibrionaceae bacterium]|nr:hypothetical protein [Cellvibrionaceae bacterium]
MNKSLRLIGLALLTSLAAACSESPEPPAQLETPSAAVIESGVDYHSLANINDYKVSHIALDLDVNFDQKTISGSATLDITALNDTQAPLILDTRDLAISKVEALGDANSSQR